MYVKLVAALDVEHEVTSVQILHHKEQVLLGKKKSLRHIFFLYVFPKASFTCGQTARALGRHLGLESAVKLGEEGILPG